MLSVSQQGVPHESSPVFDVQIGIIWIIDKAHAASCILSESLFLTWQDRAQKGTFYAKKVENESQRDKFRRRGFFFISLVSPNTPKMALRLVFHSFVCECRTVFRPEAREHEPRGRLEV